MPRITCQECHDQYASSGQAQIVPVKPDESIAHPDLDADGQELPCCRSQAVFGKADAAQGTQGRNGKIGRIGNGPQEEGRPGGDVPVEAGDEAAARHEAAGRAAEDVAHDDKGQHIACHLSNPGNDNSRQYAEEDAIDGNKLHRRQAGHIGQDDEQDHEQDGGTAKGGNIGRQTLYVPADRELPQRAVKCRDHHINPEKKTGDDDRHERLDYFFCLYLVHAIFSFLFYDIRPVAAPAS